MWLLVFCRVAGILVMLPGIGDEAIPPRVKLVMALLLSLTIAPLVAAKFPTSAAGGLHLGQLVVTETVLGFAYGALVKAFFSAITIAGTIISMQTGLSMAAVFDPTMGGQNPVLGRFLSMAAIVLIFAANVHHLFIVGMVGSYDLFAPGGAINFGDYATLAVQVLGKAFMIGVQLSAPFLLYGLIFNVALGFIARLTPSIQVFFVSQPLNMLFTFGLLLLSSGLILTLFVSYFESSVTGLMR